MASLIGALRATLSADTAKFEQGMKRAQRQAHTSSSAIGKSLGMVKAGLLSFASALTVGMLTSVIKSALDYAGNLGEVAAQAGVSTRALQEYQFMAGQVNISQEEMVKGLSKLTISMGQARAGSAMQERAFATLSKVLGQDILKAARSAEDAIPLIADAMAKIEDPAQRAALGVALMGRNFQKFAPLFEMGASGMDQLRMAAHELGIVLSEEQIANADKTADKLEAMKTVLSARIAGVVADNANSIMQLADSLGALVVAASEAAAKVARFFGQMRAEAAEFHRNNPFLANLLIGDIGKPKQLGSSVTTKLPPARPVGGGAPFVDPGTWAKSGGGGKAKSGPKGKSLEQLAAEAERKRLEALRDAHQFDEDIRRAQQDVLRASQSLVFDYRDRAQFALQILDLEKQGYDAQLKYQVAAGEITEAQAQKLRLLFDENHDLEVQAVIRDREQQRFEVGVRMMEVRQSLQLDVLRSEQQLAETASEQRDVQLRLLALYYEQERTRLQAILADKQATHAARDEARMRLANLNRTYGNDRAGVIAGTRGPMEDWMAGLPTTAAKAQEAFERLQVEGFEGLIDAAMELRNGFDDAGKALLNVLQDFLLGMIRMQLQQGLASILPAGGFKLPKFATGGSMMIGGLGGVDRNVLSMNGLPIARVSRGEMLNITPQNDRGGRPTVTMNVMTPDVDSFRRSERQINRDLRRRLAI